MPKMVALYRIPAKLSFLFFFFRQPGYRGERGPVPLAPRVVSRGPGTARHAWLTAPPRNQLTPVNTIALPVVAGGGKAIVEFV